MELIEVGALFMAGVQTVVLPWSIWATKSIFRLQSDMALNKQDDANMKLVLTGINDKLVEVIGELKAINKDFEEMKVLLAAKGIQKGS